MPSDSIVIVSAARTPIGRFQGHLSTLTASELGAHAISSAIKRTEHPTLSERIDEVIMGCVLSAGQGQAPARQAALSAGLPLETACTTLNKMCGSGMKAVMLAYDGLAAGSFNTVVAGGMESMSNAPYLLPKARTGLRMGHGQLLDHLWLDGLEDAYNPGKLMGVFAEECADQYQFSRQAQDEFAMRSFHRAQQANTHGGFAWEIQAIDDMTQDEPPFQGNLDKISQLKPAFRSQGGTVTAGNSSSIADGAAALLLMKHSTAQAMQLQPLAEIVGHATHAQQPSLFTTAPIGAMKKLFRTTGLTPNTVDLFEVNEAFAVVTMAAMQEFNLPANKVNIHGGACALGHPIGASGARILCTLIGALKSTGGSTGVASVCIGGGEATAMAIRLLNT